MIERVEGIIIKDSSYSETSKLITLITKEHGVINLLAKGAKTLKSPLRSTTTKLTHGYFNIIYKENRLSTLKEVDIIDYYKNIKQDINKISYATYILELVEQVIKQITMNSILAAIPIHLSAPSISNWLPKYDASSSRSFTLSPFSSLYSRFTKFPGSTLSFSTLG